MSKAIYSVVFVLLVAAVAAGQTLAGAVNLAAMGYGAATVRTVEADGNTATVELLATRSADGWYSVAAVRGAGGCAGAWFNPRASLPVGPFSSVSVERVGAVDVLMVRDFNGTTAYAVALVVPPC